MPIRSKSQSRYLNAKFGHDWLREHHYAGSTKDLPQHVKHQAGTTNVGLALFKAMQSKAKNRNASRT